MTKWVRAVVFGSCAGVLLITAVAAQQRDPGKSGEWAFYGGDVRATKYSPLDQINADNVKELRIAWRHPAVPLDIANAYPEVVAELPGREKNLLNDESRNNFESTPLMVNASSTRSTASVSSKRSIRSQARHSGCRSRSSPVSKAMPIGGKCGG